MNVCEKCSREVPYHLSRGMCRGCYKAWKRATDPDYAQRDRDAAVRWKERNREANRARDRATMHKPCPKCGGPMGRQHDQCARCRDRAVIERREILARMWNDGASLAEVASALDTTVNSIGATMVRLRKQGWDLPYRYARRVAA